MNNPLLEKAQYYLNESSRLTEELDTQIEYSAVLEGVLEELIGTENFLAIMEVYSNPGGVEFTSKGIRRVTDQSGKNNSEHVTKRIGQIGKILAARQSKQKPATDSTGIPRPKVMGNDGARKVPLVTRGDVDDQITRDQQGVLDAALAFKTHGGQVTRTGSLMPSASNDNVSGILMKDAKSQGVPVHINRKGGLGYPVDKEVKTGNTARLERQGARTQAALDQKTFAIGSPDMTKGELAKKQNAKKASAQRMDAGRKAAKEAGMITMPEHTNLVQTIMKFLVK